MHTIQLYFKTSKEWQLHKIPMERAENSKNKTRIPLQVKSTHTHTHILHNIKQLDNEIRTLYELIIIYQIILPF